MNDPWRPTPVAPPIRSVARSMRRAPTDAEERLWPCLRRGALSGFRFRRQHPVERFVIDFYCASARVGVELDGLQHLTTEGRARDDERTVVLEAHGIRLLRFVNSEVMNSIDDVVARILIALSAPPPAARYRTR